MFVDFKHITSGSGKEQRKVNTVTSTTTWLVHRQLGAGVGEEGGGGSCKKSHTR